MHCSHLSLTGFRNYARLELDLPTGISVVVGDNAQGKSNLLEALYLLATTKSFRAGTDRELINWRVSGTELAYARLIATVARSAGSQRVEILIREEQRLDSTDDSANSTGKRLKINDVPRRAIDFLGAVNVVMFSPTDIELVDGPPSTRRRYVDITISQIDPDYVRALNRYNRILVQRNHLLRQLRDHQGRPGYLDEWDRELATSGAYVARKRAQTLTRLGELAGDVFRGLTGQRERLEVMYRPSADLGAVSTIPPNEIASEFTSLLRSVRSRDIAAGASLVGPHRDDIAFLVDDRAMGTLGSRGQQRTVALALKLAESAFIHDLTKEEPILLLDDVLSELDERRRRQVLEAVESARQVIFTATELGPFGQGYLKAANVLRVSDGVLTADDSI